MLFRKAIVIVFCTGLISVTVLAQEEEEKATLNQVNLDNNQTQPATLATKPPVKNKDWTNTVHQTISDSVFHSVAWFDSFFMEDDDSYLSPQTVARIKLAWEPKARDFSEVGARFKLKVRLPHFKDKVDLIFSDSPDEELENLPLESVKNNQEINNDSFTAAIRYVLKNKEDFFTDTRVGLSGGDLFLQARHKRTYMWQDKHSFKLEPAIYYYLKDKAGSRLLLEYNYQINEQEQYRMNYSIKGSESFHGIRWKHGFYHLKQLSDRKAGILGLQVEGERNGEKGFLVDNYTLSYRYRFGALREWLFFEIEPFLEFPEEEDYKTTPGIALRVEGFFHRK